MAIEFRVGTQIKSIRSAKKISQTQLSNGICNINTLVRIEANETSPSFELLLALVNKLGIDMEELISNVRYQNNRTYYNIKETIEDYFSTYQWKKAKKQLELISEDIYNELPIHEQQYVDIIKIEIAKHVDRNFSYAHHLANEALYKTYKDKARYFTHQEMELINIILQFDQSKKHLELTNRVIDWIEQTPEMLRDYHAYMLLLNGISTYCYENDDWQAAYNYAKVGYKVALEKQGTKFIPSFLFTEGLSLYMLNQDQEKGIQDMKDALDFCKVTGMTEFYQAIIFELERYNIILEKGQLR
ncbi:helix-turn-helix domain-containing protein [Culicoidibacter larvae]|uniref:Helix-turn-helix transcriptional regulator n=1 Tax=Culicoidibacter larvae TaxID=2579976 RepID=A0A5R8QAH5_9FIRM|nr:helix-turn-helix transcriptional regulator [Culicoidibacter larvae]TLG71746.1 helix-turn-helix transcriptional regulator [Culicoidibacter larvae]